MKRNGICLHVTTPGALTNDGMREAQHFLVPAASDDEALEAFQAHTGSEAEYWVSYRSIDEAERWLDRRGVASYTTIES